MRIPKKCAIWVLLLFSCFPIAAQYIPKASVFVPPVSGTGSKPEDNSYFYRLTIFELNKLSFKIPKTQKGADFSLVGTITPYPDGKGQYIFRLELHDNKTGKASADGELLYSTPGDITNNFPGFVYTLLSTIPADIEDNDWRNKLLYFGGSVLWSPRVYIGNSRSTLFGNFGGSVSVEYHFLNFLSVETGLEAAYDWIIVSPSINYDYRNILLTIPLTVKYVIKPSEFYMLEAYAGACFNIPLTDETNPPLFSWLVGFQYGVKIGPGAFFIDPRFVMDIGKSTVSNVPGFKAPPFNRYIINIGIGYKYGIFNR